MSKERNGLFWLTLVLSILPVTPLAFGFLWYFSYTSQGIAMPPKAIFWFLLMLGYAAGAVGFFFFRKWGKAIIQTCSSLIIISNIYTIIFWSSKPGVLLPILYVFGLVSIVPLLIIFLTTHPSIKEKFD